MKYCVLIILSLLIFSLLVDNYNCNKLPSGNIIVGYTNWGECDEKVITAVQNGVNVVIWFSINLISDAKGNPLIDDSKINSQCIAEVALALKMQNLPTTHLISIGGWNAPHIDTKFSAKQWWSLLESWNKNVIAKPMLGFHGFDGLDIDLEGNDDLSSEFNTFTIQQMDLVGNLCQLAKKGNWVVSIAPPQSYLDIGTDEFSLSVTHRPAWKTDFPYEGKNTYAYILSKFKYTTIEESDTNNTNSITRELIHTFDIVSIQLYEGWSRANYELNDLKVPLKDFMYKLIKTMNDGWNVNLPYTNSLIQVEKSNLLIGLANGWAGGKFLLLKPDELEECYNYLKEMNMIPRGFMFWDIADEGNEIEVNNKKENLWLAKGLNRILKIRP